MDNSKFYVFYDGDCGFCNHWVKWILKHDKKDQFLFSPLQSEFGQKFLNDRNLPSKELNTIYLWKPTSFYLTKSNAIFAVARILGGVNAIVGNMNFLPSIFTDFIYDKISENRINLSSQKCLVPSEKEKKKFVELLYDADI